MEEFLENALIIERRKLLALAINYVLVPSRRVKKRINRAESLIADHRIIVIAFDKVWMCESHSCLGNRGLHSLL